MLAVYTASGAANNIVISANATTTFIVIDGFTHSTPDAAITVNSADGDDVITVLNKRSTSFLTINGWNDDDTIVVGNGDFDANGFLLGNTTLLGGAGSDSVEYLDGGDFSGDTYTWSASSLSKTTGAGTFGFNATSIETRTLQAANGFTIQGVNTVNLTTFGSEVLSTRIDCARNTNVNVAQGSLASIFGLVEVNLTSSASNLIINDQSSAGPINGYQVSPGFVRKNNTNQTINYSAVGRITLNTSGVWDVVNALGTGAGTALVLNTNGGDDDINVGSGNLDADFGGAVTVNGGAGLNDVNVNNSSDATPETMTLNGGILIDGFSHTFNSVNTLNIGGGSGGTQFLVNSTTVATTIGGGSGNDTFDVGGGDIDANLAPGSALALVLNGGGGSDSIVFSDINDTVQSADNYRFLEGGTLTAQLRRLDVNEHHVLWSNMEGITLEASNANPPGGASVISVDGASTPLRINGNAGSDYVVIDRATVPVTVHTGLGDLDTLIVGSFFEDPVTVVLEQSDDVEQLAIQDSTLRVDAGAVLRKTSLAPNPFLHINGSLDLHGAFLTSSPDGTLPFETLLRNGYNGGAWNGTHPLNAINSSLAATTPLNDGVGLGLGSDVAPTNIGPFSIAAGDTLLRYTLDGDADLNQAVDSDDFNVLAANFGQTNRIWSQGDSTYDNLVNSDDFNRLAVNFGLSAAPASSSFFSRTPIGAARLFRNVTLGLEELT